MRKEEVAGGGNVLREQIKIDTNIQLESVTQVQLDEIQYDAETTWRTDRQKSEMSRSTQTTKSVKPH